MFVSGSLDKSLRVDKDFQSIAVLVDHYDWIRCLGLSYDNSTLISGCVSSTIVGWDMYTLKPIWRLNNAHTYIVGSDLDTINSLEFCHSNDKLFVSGARDGMIKFWDTRTMDKPVITVQAHNTKLNSAIFSKSDRHLLTAGRDSTIRLWDIRNLGVYDRNVNKISTKSILVEYNKHRCVGYNIIAQFYNNENNIITGSEDKKIYIYDTLSSEVTSVLQCPHTNHVIHLVAPQPNTLDFASSSIEDIDILLWSPNAEAKKTEKQTRPAAQAPTITATNNDNRADDIFNIEKDFLLSTHRAAIETLMRTYGDKILQLFHRHNVTFSSLDWSDILSSVGNEDVTELIQMVNEMSYDFQRACEYCTTEGNNMEGLEQYLASFRQNSSYQRPNPSNGTLPVGSLTESNRPVYQSYDGSPPPPENNESNSSNNN
jgi:COMPASS component SWD3